MLTYEMRPDRFGLTDDQQRNVGSVFKRSRLGGIRQPTQEKVHAIGQYVRALQKRRPLRVPGAVSR